MFNVQKLFQASFYICLTLSTIALAYAEQVQIPGTIVFYLVVGVFLYLAYRMDGRWAMSIAQSNQLAVVIFLVWPAWLFLSLRGSRPNVDEVDIELVRLALPYGGPLMTVLLLAKLFRPKGLSDYWAIHLMGLVQVVLACVLAMTNKLDRDAPLFPLVVVAYLLCLVWTLRNFNLYSQVMPTAKKRFHRLTPTSRLETLGQRSNLGILSAVLWFGLITLVGLAFFFIVPRSQSPLGSGLNPTVKPAVTGFKPSMDLNGVGRLETSEELVFRASIFDRYMNPAKVATTPRWRGVTCSIYDEFGRWGNSRTDLTGFQAFRVPEPDREHYLVSFSLDPRKITVAGAVSTPEVPNRVLGEMPIFALEALGMTNVQPRVSLDPYSPPGDFSMVFFYQSKTEGCVSITMSEHRPQRNILYQQLIAIPMIGRTEWDQRIGRTRIDQNVLYDLSEIITMERYLQKLRTLPQKLIDSGRIAKVAEEALKEANLTADASPREKALAMEKYLLNEKRFAYSLERMRMDERLEPNEDFLENVRAGTCERFASALALMLRTQGIPARIVLGFRGADWNHLSNLYEVKEYHAHAWVEAVVEQETTEERVRVPGREEPEQTVRPVLTSIRWMTLDATPQNEASLRDTGTWAANVSFARYLWEFFILDFSGDLQRQRFLARFKAAWMEDLFSWFREMGTLGLLLLIAALLFSILMALMSLRLLRLFLHRRRQRLALLNSLPKIPFYRRFLLLVEKHFRLLPEPPQTALEFSGQAKQMIAQQAAASAMAGLPERLAEAYHAVRFGGLAAEETARKFDVELDKLQALLK